MNDNVENLVMAFSFDGADGKAFILDFNEVLLRELSKGFVVTKYTPWSGLSTYTHADNPNMRIEILYRCDIKPKKADLLEEVKED
jgi:hypothetical protein